VADAAAVVGGEEWTSSENAWPSLSPVSLVHRSLGKRWPCFSSAGFFPPRLPRPPSLVAALGSPYHCPCLRATVTAARQHIHIHTHTLLLLLLLQRHPPAHSSFLGPTHRLPCPQASAPPGPNHFTNTFHPNTPLPFTPLFPCSSLSRSYQAEDRTTGTRAMCGVGMGRRTRKGCMYLQWLSSGDGDLSSPRPPFLSRSVREHLGSSLTPRGGRGVVSHPHTRTVTVDTSPVLAVPSNNAARCSM
jgi:hypothetical protein